MLIVWNLMRSYLIAEPSLPVQGGKRPEVSGHISASQWFGEGRSLRDTSENHSVRQQCRIIQKWVTSGIQNNANSPRFTETLIVRGSTELGPPTSLYVWVNCGKRGTARWKNMPARLCIYIYIFLLLCRKFLHQRFLLKRC